jgi:purine-binding chemotaxis protein CheW
VSRTVFPDSNRDRELPTRKSGGALCLMEDEQPNLAGKNLGGAPMAGAKTTFEQNQGPAGEAGAAPEEHVVVFSLAGEQYGLDIQVVQEIVRMQSITSIPGSEPWIEGITNLRGRVTPVIDLRRRCLVPVAPHTAETRMIVVNSGSGMVGLIVDAVSEVIRIPADQIEMPNNFVSAAQNTYLRGIAKLDDRLVSLMDLDGVLPSPMGDTEAGVANPAVAPAITAAA